MRGPDLNPTSGFVAKDRKHLSQEVIKRNDKQFFLNLFPCIYRLLRTIIFGCEAILITSTIHCSSFIVLRSCSLLSSLCLASPFWTPPFYMFLPHICLRNLISTALSPLIPSICQWYHGPGHVKGIKQLKLYIRALEKNCLWEAVCNNGGRAFLPSHGRLQNASVALIIKFPEKLFVIDQDVIRHNTCIAELKFCIVSAPDRTEKEK